jgi:hypothetical protein
VSLQKIAIAVFCLWHMMATGVYSLSSDWGISPISALKNTLQEDIRGYVLLTSQWQQWNLFSPDPLRRVSRYAVERSDCRLEASLPNNCSWTPVLTVDESIAWWRRASILKMFRRMEDTEVNDPLVLRMLAIVCRDAALPPGASVRIRRQYFVLPKHERPAPLARWRAYTPTWSESTIGETSCSSAA